MKTGGGDFNAEAYQQLREAYDKEQQRQVDDEIAGTKLMGQEYGLETLPVDSPWADKIDLWEYPDGKRSREDEKQSPDEILQIMRDAAQERVEAKKEAEDPDGLDEMSDEELDEHVNKILAEAGVEDEDVDEESEDDEDEESESDEDDEEEEDEEDEEEEDEEEVDEGENEGLVQQDPEDVAAEIAALRAELDAMQFVPEEEPETDDESE